MLCTAQNGIVIVMSLATGGVSCLYGIGRELRLAQGGYVASRDNVTYCDDLAKVSVGEIELLTES